MMFLLVASSTASISSHLFVVVLESVPVVNMLAGDEVVESVEGVVPLC
jgi:hypothetical protein